MKIKIAFSKPIGFKIGAELIAWWMGEQYSHVLIIFEYPDSRAAVFHAAHGMVHFKSLDNFLKDNIIVKEYQIELSKENQSTFFDDCMDLAGEEYSVEELAQILAVDLAFMLFKRDIGSKEMSGYICSELVGKFCIDRLSIQFNKPTYLLKPNHIDIALMRREQEHGTID